MANVIGTQTSTVAHQVASQRGCFEETVQDGLVDLTRAFTFAMFDGKGKVNSSLFVPNGLFLGGLFGDIRGGAEAYEQFCDMIATMDLRIVFTNQSFAVHPFGWNECLVVFSSHLFMSEEGSKATMISKPLRIVFDWLLVGDLPRIMYLEMSFPLSQGDAMDSFGAESKHAGTLTVAARGDSPEERLLEVHNLNRGLVFLGYDEILCIEAKGRKSRILLEDDSIEVSESIGQIEQQIAGEDGSTLPFIRIHRSYLVNAWHLRTLTSDCATLDDGTRVSVSARRLSEIRAQLRELRRPRSIALREFVKGVRDAR